MQSGLGKAHYDRPLADTLPFGAIVAVCDLVDCRGTDSFTVGELDAPRMPEAGRPDSRHLYSWTERMLGDFAPGRFGWLLENVRMLPEPIPCNGARSLWDVPADVLAQVQAELQREQA